MGFKNFYILSEAKFGGKELFRKPKYVTAISTDIVSGNKILVHLGKKATKFAGETKELTFVNTHKDIESWIKVLSTTENPVFQTKEGVDVTLTNIDKTPYSGVGGKEPSGAQWEALIAQGWNLINKIPNPLKHTDAEAVEKFWNEYGDVATKMAKSIRATVKSNKPMIQYGAGSASLSKMWKGSNTTPKTDMYVGNMKISLKKEGGSQVMSAKRDEAVSTMESAMMLVGMKKNSVAGKLANVMMSNMSDNLDTETGGFNDLKKMQKQGKKLSPKQLIVMKQDKINKDLGSKINDFFNKDQNETFREYFCYEAATGHNKFKDDLPKSNYMVKFYLDGNADVDYLGENGEIVDKIRKMANGIKLDVSFKSSKGKVYPALRGYLKESMGEDAMSFNEILEEELSKEITNDVLSEGIIDVIKNRLKLVWEKVTERAKKALQKMVAMGKNAIMMIMEFFGVKIENVNAQIPAILMDDWE